MSDDEIKPGWIPPYSPDLLTSLSEEVDRQGGAVLPDRCEPTFIKFPKPQSDKVDVAKTCACGNDTMAAIPYEPAANGTKLKTKMLERGAGFARICLVCDGAALWPRFVSAVEGID